MNFKHLPQWAKSSGQRPIELYHSNDFDWKKASSSPLLFIGGMHGDEPEGVRIAYDLLGWLKNAALQQTLAPWVLIPCINPDGYENNKRVNDNGVDLNRNFPAQSWSPDFKESRYFPGTGPGSEPEIKALVDFILQYHPGLIIHFHSWNPCVVYTGHTGKTYAQMLAESSKYPLQESIGYPTPGSLSQFGWIDHKIPIICTEEQEHSDLNKTWGNFGPGLIQILTSYPKL